MKIGDGPLCMRSGRKDEALVAGQNLEPGGEIAGVIWTRLQLRHNAKIGAEKAASEFRDHLLARPLAPILAVAAEIAVRAMPSCRPMRRLMAQRRDLGFPIGKRRERRHLDVVGRRGVVGAVAAMSDDGAGLGEETIGIIDPRDRVMRRF